MFVRVRAVAAKELWALVRQPQLLLLLLGPVLIMAVFGLSFKAEYAKPSAVVVVPPGSEGAELFERFRPKIVSHVNFEGTLESLEAADRLIKNGEVDGAIVVPEDPAAAIADDERAVIGARYSAIHPIRGQTVPNRSGEGWSRETLPGRWAAIGRVFERVPRCRGVLPMVPTRHRRRTENRMPGSASPALPSAPSAGSGSRVRGGGSRSRPFILP